MTTRSRSEEAKKTPSEPTLDQKCTFRKRPFPKPSKFRRRARSLCCPSHENFSDSKKTPFLTPSRKGPGLTFDGLPVLVDRVVFKVVHFFVLGPILSPNGQSVKKCTFELSKVPPGSSPGRRSRGLSRALPQEPLSTSSRRRFATPFFDRKVKLWIV